MKFLTATAISLTALVGLGNAWTVTLFENESFRGPSHKVHAQRGVCSNTNGFNDQTSSVKGDNTEHCTYFANGSCHGALFSTKPGENKPTVPVRANDKVSSIRCG